jgi:hypothetical protein
MQIATFGSTSLIARNEELKEKEKYVNDVVSGGHRDNDFSGN